MSTMDPRGATKLRAVKGVVTTGDAHVSPESTLSSRLQGHSPAQRQQELLKPGLSGSSALLLIPRELVQTLTDIYMLARPY